MKPQDETSSEFRLVKATEHPEVSVVIPCYDVPADHLRQAIDSVIDQTMTNWEAIVVDDGGSDFSIHEMVTSIADKRVRAVSHSHNRGMGAARNTGIKNAQAPLVALLDADDRLHPDYLRVMTATFQSVPGDTWVWPDIEVFGEKAGEWRFPNPPIALCPAHMDYRGGSSLLPVKLWETVGGFSEDRLLSSLEDMDFWMGALEAGASPTYVHELLYEWRVASDSASFQVSRENHLQRDEIFRRRHSLFEAASPCPECPGRDPGSVFRAWGYHSASVLERRSGRRLRSLKLGLRGWLLNPANPAIGRNLVRAVIPGLITKLWHRFTRFQASRRAVTEDPK
jgi:GT2 family glycosyltransferase